MLCRICLDEGTPSTLLTPCRCIGTSQYIHRDCLDLYFTHYPDRMCRVCRTELAGPPTHQDKVLLAVVLVGLGITLTGSAMSFAAKSMMGLLLLGASAFFVRNNLFNQTVAIGTLIVYTTFIYGGNPEAVMTVIVVLCAIATATTLLLYIPAIYVVAMTVVLVVFAYVLVTSIAFAVHADSLGLTVYACLVYMAWYAWVRVHPPPRLRG